VASMRGRGTCPVADCDQRVGRVEDRIVDSETVLIYWHWDLPQRKEFCIEHPNGETEQVKNEKQQSTSPKV